MQPGCPTKTVGSVLPPKTLLPKRVTALGMASAEVVSTPGSAVIALENKQDLLATHLQIPSGEFASLAACVSVLNNEVE